MLIARNDINKVWLWKKYLQNKKHRIPVSFCLHFLQESMGRGLSFLTFHVSVCQENGGNLASQTAHSPCGLCWHVAQRDGCLSCFRPWPPVNALLDPVSLGAGMCYWFTLNLQSTATAKSVFFFVLCLGLLLIEVQDLTFVLTVKFFFSIPLMIPACWDSVGSWFSFLTCSLSPLCGCDEFTSESVGTGLVRTGSGTFWGSKRTSYPLTHFLTSSDFWVPGVIPWCQKWKMKFS